MMTKIKHKRQTKQNKIFHVQKKILLPFLYLELENANQ